MLSLSSLPRKIGEFTNQIFSSIALLPTLITLIYVAMVLAMMHFDHSSYAESLIERFPWMKFKEMQTGRTILSTLITGIISLIVLSFSMVMVVLSQAINNYSPKVMVGVISEKNHQFVLGNQLGSVIYFMILLLHLKNQESLEVPSFSIFVSVLLGIWSMILFVYFIHTISRNVQITNIVKRIHDLTLNQLKQINKKNAHYTEPDVKQFSTLAHAYITDKPGFMQEVRVKRIVRVAAKYDMVIKLHGYLTNYIESRRPLFHANIAPDKLSEGDRKIIYNSIVFYNNESPKGNYVYGFTQLSEVAVKALSPGINDPGIARLCLQYLTDMFVELYHLKERCVFTDKEGKVRLIVNKINFLDLLNTCVTPVRQYGKKDLVIVKSLLSLLKVIAQQDMREKRYQHEVNEQAKAILEICHEQEFSIIDKQAIDAVVDDMTAQTQRYFYLERLTDGDKIRIGRQSNRSNSGNRRPPNQAHSSETT